MVGNVIGALRRSKNMTQNDLAKKLGCTQGTICKYESGQLSIGIEMLPELARILDCTIDDLFREQRSTT